jgi:hypothetical protein
MLLSRQTRQVIGAAIGAAIAAVLSTWLGLSAPERHEQAFGTAQQTQPAR